MQEWQVQSLGQENTLEKEMATYSSILAWEIPWTEEPGGLQSMGVTKELDTTQRLNNNNITFRSDQIRSVAQSCPTLCDPTDCSPPGSSVHGIFRAGILEWVAISFSRGSSRPRDRTCVSYVSLASSNPQHKSTR